MAKLKIIIASTRPGRIGLTIGEWFENHAKEHGGKSSRPKKRAPPSPPPVTPSPPRLGGRAPGGCQAGENVLVL
ncbi:hypothetical protein [Streptacidiphilus sp. EB103A]|uniref:hypothetical protein n=1 Tax=Streptacidiphilus sp. EB103A TaxID=3156275 RepID=UPI0035156673